MLKDSMLDFDNSRNDVVPQRTQLEDEYASVVESKEEEEESSCCERSLHRHDAAAGIIESAKKLNLDVESDSEKDGEAAAAVMNRDLVMVRESYRSREDEEAQEVAQKSAVVGRKKRERHVANNSDIPLTADSKIILQ